MGFFDKILKQQNQDKLFPEFNWEISIYDNTLKSVDWNNEEKTINLSHIKKIYIRTSDDGPSCDVWYGIETENGKIEIPQGARGESMLLNFMESLDGFKLKGMNSIENKIHVCWENNSTH